MRKASQKEAQTKEMKDLTWEVGEIEGGGFSALTDLKKTQNLLFAEPRKPGFQMQSYDFCYTFLFPRSEMCIKWTEEP